MYGNNNNVNNDWIKKGRGVKMRDYSEMIQVIANSDRTVEERGELVVRDMCRTINAILDYKYTLQHFADRGTALEDKRNVVKNNLALLENDLDIYKQMLGIGKEVFTAKVKRAEKVAGKIEDR